MQLRTLANFFAFEETLRNGCFVAVGDINSDGLADMILGSGPGGSPRVRIADMAGLLAGESIEESQIASFFAGDEESREGVRVAAANIDGDTISDVVVGSGDGTASRVSVIAGASIVASPTRPQSLGNLLSPFDDLALNGAYVG